LGVRATLVPRSYLLVNAAIRMNTNGQENFGNVVYGKQNLIDDALTEAVSASNRRAIDRDGGDHHQQLARLGGTAEPRVGFGKTFVNDR
jgi:hypothetical protein